MLINEWLRAQREARDMSQAQMARMIGVSQSAYSRVEKGEHGITMRTLRRFIGAIGEPLFLYFDPTDGAPIAMTGQECLDMLVEAKEQRTE